ncbi:shufflon system plasmid conjugative transfer pilus tip adhesin PilV [Pseudomonas sp. AA4]|uniref:shufflon system plasmid conjugative transfer pilus tip adhesin PilV n=1 Tax=unclassified Pseudomonas TaxID=196821 RepID=UPI002B237AF4|nr:MULTISPECIES: shufflon system plasmid conjugative transfer pilus tip adhesin PilV [unclassified Pseudomonas]MEA9996497.1 shufflon system plasmid conjugative transfer pilus tip adhesin PilV [Pseudomonas sp. AA4]MEB0222208.1 shufflon system plasmid conjugative transfer pilus tip adhesin PilV [Pseudomonas sp. AB12(2023)]
MEVSKAQFQLLKKQGGFIAIEFMFAIIAFVTLCTIGANMLARYQDSQNYQIAAQQHQTVANAAAKYLKDNFSAVVAVATPTIPAQITTTMLRNTNYLPGGFGDTNAFGQRFLVLARSPAANQLESIVLTTGGETIDEIGTREIAENLGGAGGFIPTTNTSIVQGVRGGWQIALSNYGMNPGVGHNASALFLQDGTLVNDYLYRNAVAGHPEVNTMNTSINVNGNNLNGVNATNTTTLNATTVNTNVENATTTNTTGETTTGGWFRTTGDTGWYSQKWGGGWYMSDPTWLRAYADKNIYTGGQVQAGTLASVGRTTVGEYLQINGIASLGGGCASNGLIGRDVHGLALSCKDGIWRGGGVSGTYQYIGNFVGAVTLTTGSQAAIVQVSGGVDYTCGPNGGSSGVNEFSLVAYVNGSSVAGTSDANPDWSKSGYISFGVPANTAYSIQSYPYSCTGGVFSVFAFLL